MNGIQAKDLFEALRRHYLRRADAPAGLFLTEVGAPDGRRRADALWIPARLSGSIGAGIVGHEIKVTRADVLHELEQPTKAESWAQYCSKWWLVVPDEKLIAGLQIPERWGVLALPKNHRFKAMRTIKPAPELEPVDLTPAIGRLSTVLAYDRMELQGKAINAEAEADRYLRDLRELKKSNPQHNNDPIAEKIREIQSIIQLNNKAPVEQHVFLRSILSVPSERIAKVLMDLADVEALLTALRDEARYRHRVLDGLLSDLFASPWSQLAREHLAQLAQEISSDSAAETLNR